ncbi:MAG: MGMT family protein, partial [Bacteroidetes bacterium]|nr:MGMT family protein [Bacteroidota bacterium]
YQVVRSIPRGRVCTYGLIADFLGLGSSRMVGWALNQVAGHEGVPAHRVVNREGLLSGRHHFPTPSFMASLLEAEGVQIVEDKVADFKALLWRPEEGLGIDWEYEPVKG